MCRFEARWVLDSALVLTQGPPRHAAGEDAQDHPWWQGGVPASLTTSPFWRRSSLSGSCCRPGGDGGGADGTADVEVGTARAG